MQKEISLIIPIYNGKNHLDSMLNSIISVDTPMEVLIIDDGSTDGSSDYLGHWIEEENKHTIHDFILVKKENSGVAATRNLGIKKASAPFIMFCDQDDRFSKEYPLKYLEAIKSVDADIVVGGYERVREDGKIITKISLSDDPWSKFIVTAPWAHIYNRKFLIDNSIEFLKSPIGEDVYFNILAYSKAKKVQCIPDISYKWMYNTKSVSNAKQNTIRDDIDPLFLMDSIYKNIDSIEFRDSVLLEYFFARYICWYMLFSSRGSKKDDIKNAYTRLHNWIYIHYPNYKKNKYIGIKMPKGEIISTHRFVFIYYFLLRLGLLPFILTLFGK